MAEVKIEIKIGNISFSGEGDSGWLEKQLDKIIEKASDLVKIAPQQTSSLQKLEKHKPADLSGLQNISKKSLASFLKDKSATTNQIDKFLVASVWLESKGKSRIKTGDVTKTLRENSQSKLGNASDCLNKNVSKGFCEKDGTEFFVTQEGKEHLGL